MTAQAQLAAAMQDGRQLIVRVARALAVCLLLGGCAQESIDRFILDMPRPESNTPILHKKYDKPPMEWQQFNELLEMAIYRGSAGQYGQLVMRERTDKSGMAPVLFSHSTHRRYYTCRVCHLELEFSMRKGESGITRQDYLEGRFCGACHNGSIAFSVKQACNLCHVSEGRASQSNSTEAHMMSIAGLPTTEYGNQVDWVKAIETGAIQPKNSLEDQPVQMMSLPDHLNQSLRWYTNVSGVHVSFPHKAHIAWLDCANCHPDLFDIKKMGTVAFDKEKNLYGMYCGACHMTVAFPMNGCGRCHPGHKDYSVRRM